MASSSGIICLSRCKNTKKRRYTLIPLISGKEVSVGRGLDVSVQLLSRKRDSMILLSRKHAIFKESEDGKWTITDNKSLNGVYLNDVRVKAGSPFPIEVGDMIQIGAVQEGETEAEFVFQVKVEEMSLEKANQILNSLHPASVANKRKSQTLPAKEYKGKEVVTSKHNEGEGSVAKRKRCDDWLSNKVMKSSESQLRTDEPGSSNVTCERTSLESPLKSKATLSEEEGEILNAILSQRGKHSIQEIIQMIQSKSLSPSKKREDDDLRLMLEEKERLLKVKEEEMRATTEDLKAKALEKENCLMEQIEAQRKALQVEKQAVEESLQSEVAKNLEQREKLEKERKRLEDVIAGKDEEYKAMETKLEEGQKARQDEEEMKIAKAKQEAFDNITHVLESELQCSICAELFIQATTLNCSHSFCKYCIMLWMARKKECPVCRAPIKSYNRSIVLDNYIDKMVESLGKDVKIRRKEMLDDRKKTEGDKKLDNITAPVLISSPDEDEEEEDVEFIDSGDSDNSENYEEDLAGPFYGGDRPHYI
ncbi:E3 ubiquitin-protein ligase RNF8-like isoform X3 [Apostichopus japonicus]|uniref:E3 ubiquitin-protein ligase RNF8-like isoform X3 n=1 Tax=Stichopus japonicus TaxID=307972 RepID=UPI003AB126E4